MIINYYTNPDLPLTSGNKIIASGMVLASGEGNFFDISQHQDHNGGSGINYIYPSPNYEGSGIYPTYPPDDDPLIDSVEQSGIFHYNNLSGVFSNGESSSGIRDFGTFNAYIHYIAKNNTDDIEDRLPVKIPFVSDAEERRINTLRNPYELSSNGIHALYLLGIEDQTGACVFADGTCSRVTQEYCSSFPGAAWHQEENCEDI